MGLQDNARPVWTNIRPVWYHEAPFLADRIENITSEQQVIMGQHFSTSTVLFLVTASGWFTGAPGWAANDGSFRPSSHPNVFVRNSSAVSTVHVKAYSVPGFAMPVLMTSVANNPKPAAPPASPNSVMLDSRLDLALSASIDARGELTLSCTRRETSVAPDVRSEDGKR